MSERIVNDPSLHGWVEIDGKWVWDASAGGSGAGMVISETEPADKVEGMQWLNPTTGLVLFWDDEKWLQMPTTGAAGKDGVDGLWTDNGDTTISYTAGSVGIGTGSPSAFAGNGAALHISGANTTSELRLTRGDGADLSIIAGSVGGKAIIQTNNDTALKFATNNTERMRINSDGNVGIGTDNPLAPLEIKGSSSGQNILHLSNSAGTSDGTAKNQIRVTCNGNNNWANLDIQAYATMFTQKGTERMRIGADGRVDITGSLYVNGTPKIGTVDMIKAFSKLRDAVKDEDTVESLKESITNCIGGLIEEWEAMQSPATQEISNE